MRRQVRLGRGEAVEKELWRAWAVAREPVAEPHARLTEAVTGDLVDGACVEVVDQRVPVTVECVGTDGRERGGDGIERLLHRLVDRRAPVGEPSTSALLQLRMKEPFGDRAGGKLEDRERGTCRSTRFEIGRWLGGESDQLGEPDPARGRTVPECRQIGDGRDADVQPAGGERAVGAARDDGRTDILLPQDLERRALAGEVELDRLWFEHNPSGYGQEGMPGWKSISRHPLLHVCCTLRVILKACRVRLKGQTE